MHTHSRTHIRSACMHIRARTSDLHACTFAHTRTYTHTQDQQLRNADFHFFNQKFCNPVRARSPPSGWEPLREKRGEGKRRVFSTIWIRKHRAQWSRQLKAVLRRWFIEQTAPVAGLSWQIPVHMEGGGGGEGRVEEEEAEEEKEGAVVEGSRCPGHVHCVDQALKRWRRLGADCSPDSCNKVSGLR